MSSSCQESGCRSMCCWSNPWERVEREEEEEGSVDEDDMKLDRQRERVRGGGGEGSQNGEPGRLSG